MPNDIDSKSQTVSYAADDSIAEIRRDLQRLTDLEAQEPTDEQLAKIWSPWNALQSDIIRYSSKMRPDAKTLLRGPMFNKKMD